MPFCHLRLKAEKPRPEAYPRALKTLGDHIRKRRLDLDLLQKEAAERIGVHTSTLMNWERGRTSPAVRQIPRIIAFLGYMPFAPGPSWPERLGTYRQINGLSQAKLAARLGVDEGTIKKWESGKSRPHRKRSPLIEEIVRHLARQKRARQLTSRQSGALHYAGAPEPSPRCQARLQLGPS